MKILRTALFSVVIALMLTICVFAGNCFNADFTAEKNADKINCEIDLKPVNGQEFSSFEFFVSVSDGLDFNNDVTVEGGNEAWSLWKPVFKDGTLTIAYVDETCKTPVISDIKLKFSFKVVTEGINKLKLMGIDAYDEIAAEIPETEFTVGKDTFMTGFPDFTNIRTALRVNNNKALKFKFSVLKNDAYRSYLGDGEFKLSQTLRFGMLVAKKSDVKGELTVDNKYADNTVFTRTTEEDSEKADFTLVKIIEDTSTEYVVRAYAAYTLRDGSVVYIYSDPVVRSAVSVANVAIEHESNAKVINYLNKIIQND